MVYGASKKTIDVGVTSGSTPNYVKYFSDKKDESNGAKRSEKKK